MFGGLWIHGLPFRGPSYAELDDIFFVIDCKAVSVFFCVKVTVRDAQINRLCRPAQASFQCYPPNAIGIFLFRGVMYQVSSPDPSS